MANIGLLFTEKKTIRTKAIVFTGVAVLVYLIERIIVNVLVNYNTIVQGGQAEFIFGFPYMIPFIEMKFNIEALITIVGLLLVASMVIRTREDILLMVWNLIPILIFGIWWESQLWVPIFLIIFMKNYMNIG